MEQEVGDDDTNDPFQFNVWVIKIKASLTLLMFEVG